MSHAQKHKMAACHSLEPNSHGSLGQKGIKIIPLPPIKKPCIKQGGKDL